MMNFRFSILDFGLTKRIPHSMRGWMVLLGLLTIGGFIKVAMTATLWRSAYAAAQQAARIHAIENDTQWLQTQVVALQAPAHLAKTMASERTSFVARTELPATLTTRLAQTNRNADSR